MDDAFFLGELTGAAFGGALTAFLGARFLLKPPKRDWVPWVAALVMALIAPGVVLAKHRLAVARSAQSDASSSPNGFAPPGSIAAERASADADISMAEARASFIKGCQRTCSADSPADACTEVCVCAFEQIRLRYPTIQAFAGWKNLLHTDPDRLRAEMKFALDNCSVPAQ